VTQNLGRTITISEHALEGDLVIPPSAHAIIIFAHGSGSSRHSTRNQYVAHTLNERGFATLLIDLLNQQEKKLDEETRHFRYNVELLAKRFAIVTEWILQETDAAGLKIGYFGSSTGAAAAFIAADGFKDAIKTIVCRGGRPDLAASRDVLQNIYAPTLLIVGGNDACVTAINKSALSQLSNAEARELAIIPGASHLFEEPGKMEEVAQVAAEWFECYLLRNGKKFENRYAESKFGGIWSSLKNRSIDIKIKDRASAGQMLSSALSKYKGNLTVIGIARGGFVVADALAKKLDVKPDIIVAMRLRSPYNPENALGAIMQDGSFYVDEKVIQDLKLPQDYIENEKSEQTKEIQRRLAAYRPKQKDYAINGRNVILVDDGAATGATIIVAARWIKTQNPTRLIIALPIASKKAAKLLKAEADRVEVIRTPSKFGSVEQFYQDFSPVTDEEIISLINASG
jgi:putative phosphoribosyl transferase